VELPEIEQLVGEAENRVERLRSLYDQYFMGIERIEPQIARKDVERRIQILRKTQIRNTALRFRFQNVLLRYNTFSAHWMRICRQIEDGTYKHHLRKAKERFDPNLAAKESRDARKKAAALEYGDTEPPPAPEYGIDEDLDVDIDFEDPVAQPDVRAALRQYSIPQEAMAPSVAGRAVAAMTGVQPGINPATTTPTRPAPARDASLDRSTDRAPPPVPSVVPAKPAPPPLRIPGPPPLARPPIPGRPTGNTMPPPLPGGARPAGPPAATAPAPIATRPAPAPTAAPTARPAVGPVVPAAARPAPVPAFPLQRPATVPMTGAPIGRPAPAPAAVARPPVAAAPVAARPAPAPVAAKPAASQVDERTRQIYSKYVETKRSLGESTASITMDGMAKTIRDSEEKLRQKHPGKAVNFEVQVKDGKTVLKPIVR